MQGGNETNDAGLYIMLVSALALYKMALVLDLLVTHLRRAEPEKCTKNISFFQQFLNTEYTFQGAPWIEFTREHAEIPIFAVCLYFILVFHVPHLVRGKLELPALFATWNLTLAVFSVIGAVRTVPHLFFFLSSHGFDYTVCTDPKDWFLDGRAGFWVALFIFSKIPELLDTFFLVVQKKQVICLHWFHHVTVLLYCWHSYHNRVATGLWFAAMNFSVHAFMYSYYFLVSNGLKRPARFLAPIITVIQILQMFVGALVTLSSAMSYYKKGSKLCAVNPANFKMGFAMYCSYMVLFCLLFQKKYMSSSHTTSPSKDTICGVEMPRERVDVAGRFCSYSSHDKDS